jgi:hypothetical protein
MFSVLGKKTPSPLYCAVTLRMPSTTKVVSQDAEPLTKEAVPNRLEPSRNVTVPDGTPELPGPAATSALIVMLVSTVVFGAEILIVLTKPAVIAPNSPLLSSLNCEVK